SKLVSLEDFNALEAENGDRWFFNPHGNEDRDGNEDYEQDAKGLSSDFPMTEEDNRKMQNVDAVHGAKLEKSCRARVGPNDRGEMRDKTKMTVKALGLLEKRFNHYIQISGLVIFKFQITLGQETGMSTRTHLSYSSQQGAEYFARAMELNT
ncbi:hypothetical protein AMTR_s00017p00247100, partial [Amborella trichopoda]